MNSGLFAEFEKIRADLEQGVPVPNLSTHLGALDIKFASVSDDYRLMSDGEQQHAYGDFLQIQYIYHELSMVFITRILETSSLRAREMDVHEHQPINVLQEIQPVELPAEQRVVEQSTENQVASTIEQKSDSASDQFDAGAMAVPSPVNQEQIVTEPLPSNDMEIEQDSEHIVFSQQDVWDDEEDDSTLPAPPFKLYCAIMEPIFALKPVRQVNEEAINVIIETITSAANQAREQNFSIVPDSPIIIAAIQRKLDLTSRTVWSWYQEVNEISLDNFVLFLTKRAKSIEPAELATNQNGCKPCTGALPKISKASSSASINQPGPSGAAAKPPKKVRAFCPNCHGEHFLHRCDLFRALLLKDRREIVDRASLCRNCFSSLHATSACKIGGCKRCKNAKHNSLVCAKETSKQLRFK